MSRISSRSWVSAARRCTSSRTAERVRRRAAASRSAVRTASESDKLPARTISSASAEASSRRTCSDRATAPSVARIVLQISTHTFHTVAPRGLVHGPKRVSGGPSRRPHGGTAGLFRLQEQPTPRNRRPELPSPVGERAFILWTGWRDVLVASHIPATFWSLPSELRDWPCCHRPVRPPGWLPKGRRLEPTRTPAQRRCLRLSSLAARTRFARSSSSSAPGSFKPLGN